MSYGFQIISNFNRVQVDQDFSAPRLIAAGTAPLVFLPAYGVWSANVVFPMPYNIFLEPPVVMVRPAATGKYVGGYFSGKSADFTTFDGMADGGFSVSGQCAFDYAVFSTRGTAVADAVGWGLEVYKADGSMAFSSRHSHPRIRGLLTKAASTASDGGYPNAFSVSGFSAMPWLLANPLVQTAFGLGPNGETIGGAMAAVASGFGTVTIDLRDCADPAFPSISTTAAAATADQYNPYQGKPAFFAVGAYA